MRLGPFPSWCKICFRRLSLHLKAVKNSHSLLRDQDNGSVLLLASNTYVLIAPPGFWKGNSAGLALWFVILDFWVIGGRVTCPLSTNPGRLGSRVCVSSPVVQCRTCSSLWLGPCCKALYVLAVLAGTTEVKNAVNLNITKTNFAMCYLMPFWTPSWPLLSIALGSQPVPRATAVLCTEISGLGEMNFSVCYALLRCLIPQSLINSQPFWIILEYVTEVEWSTVLVFSLEVWKIFCIPKQIICFGC